MYLKAQLIQDGNMHCPVSTLINMMLEWNIGNPYSIIWTNMFLVRLMGPWSGRHSNTTLVKLFKTLNQNFDKDLSDRSVRLFDRALLHKRQGLNNTLQLSEPKHKLLGVFRSPYLF